MNVHTNLPFNFMCQKEIGICEFVGQEGDDRCRFETVVIAIFEIKNNASVSRNIPVLV